VKTTASYDAYMADGRAAFATFDGFFLVQPNRGGSDSDSNVATHPKGRDVVLNHTHNVYGYHEHIAQTWMQTSLSKHWLRNPADSLKGW
jgi:hypothetical protein